ncbi:MAG: response regulator transcription factor [Butyrivibrio sp.]|nr:response regulator transcription factor [Butyrivibrio sp.]
MNIAIVDDLKADSDQLKSILTSYAYENSLDLSIEVFSGGEEFLSEYENYNYTLIFMDIYMNGITGIETARKIRETDTDTAIVFLTSSSEFMPEAFSIHAYDYISKPAEIGRLYKVMDDFLKKKTMAVDVPYLFFTYEKDNVSVPYSDIALIRSIGHYNEIILKNQRTYKVRMTFASISDILSEDIRFLPVMRGILVNMDYITSLKNGSCFIAGDIQTPITLKKEKQLEQIWKNYIFNKIRNESEVI